MFWSTLYRVWLAAGNAIGDLYYFLAEWRCMCSSSSGGHSGSAVSIVGRAPCLALPTPLSLVGGKNLQVGERSSSSSLAANGAIQPTVMPLHGNDGISNGSGSRRDNQLAFLGKVTGFHF